MVMVMRRCLAVPWTAAWRGDQVDSERQHDGGGAKREKHAIATAARYEQV